MADKIMGVVGWIVLFAIIIGAIFFVAQPIIWSDNYADWVVYARAFLLLSLISTFAQLRLFNAIVKNSLFLIKLRDAVYKLTEKFPMLDKGLRTLNVTLTNNNSRADALKKSIDVQNEATDKLTEKIDRIKFNAKDVK